MTTGRKSIAERILEAEVAIVNAITDADIKAALALFGYTDEKLHVGKALLDNLKELDLKQKNDYAEQYAATDALNVKRDEADKLYAPALKVARIAFKNDVTALNSLALQGKRKDSISGWLHQAEQFYSNLMASEAMMAAMAGFGFDARKLQNGQLLVTEVKDAKLLREREKGEAQQATKNRDEKLDELGEWIGEFKEIAAIALEENPQWLEKLGILVKS